VRHLASGSGASAAHVVFAQATASGQRGFGGARIRSHAAPPSRRTRGGSACGGTASPYASARGERAGSGSAAHAPAASRRAPRTGPAACALSTGSHTSCSAAPA
jgi:hypothetical protein